MLYFICRNPYSFPVIVNVADVLFFVKVIFLGASIILADDVKVTVILTSGYPCNSKLDFVWLTDSIGISGTIKIPLSHNFPL